MNDESEKVLKNASDLCSDERELEAEVLLTEQLAIDPDNLEIMTMLGEVQAHLCNDSQAEATLRAVLIRDPDYEDAVSALGALLDQSLRTEEAEKLYREFLLRNPAGHRALEGLCRLLISEDRSGDALQLARKQVVEFEDDFDAYKPIIYVLEILEDDLESALLEDWNDQTTLSAYLDNLLEQLEITLKLENFEVASEDFICELQDEKSRLVCEIDQLFEQAASRSITISSDLKEQISSILRIVRNESQN